MRRSVPVLLLLASCGGADDVCAVPSKTATPGIGDANGDGRVDLADVAFVQGNLLRAGPAPVCEWAADYYPDGVYELGDSFSLLGWLYQGMTFTPALSHPCEGGEPLPDPACGRMAWTIDAPGKVSGAAGQPVDVEAKIGLVSRDLAVEGWQLSVSGDGCEVTSATTDGTPLADPLDGGLADRAYRRADVTEDGAAVSVGQLSWLDGTTLPPGKDARTLLDVHLTATAPASGCGGTCVVRLEDGRRGPGQPVDNEVVVGGRAYRPELVEATVKVCGP